MSFANPSRALTLSLLLAVAPVGARGAGLLNPGLADPEHAPWRVAGNGMVTDASHPKHPGDFYRADIVFRLAVRPDISEARIEVESGEPAARDTDVYFCRRGRIFQPGEGGIEVAPTPPLGDVSAAAVAALHPALVEVALRQRPENARRDLATGATLFAWNDELWRIERDPKTRRIRSLTRRLAHDVLGDLTEQVRYEAWSSGLDPSPARVVVTSRGRETFRVELRGAALADSVPVPLNRRTGDRLLARSDIVAREIAPHLFAIDLDSLNTRVTVAEFSDHLVVLEGAFDSFNCDLIARVVRERFGKPVASFAFSHLHGQYVGGVRSWVHEGATVIVPPTTAPLIESVVKEPRTLRPDALAREPRPLHIRTVKDSLRLEDDVNALTIYNVESGHTDEYFIFYFPRAKLLVSGDLFFYRPGKPLAARSQMLCANIHRLGLDVRTIVATWPLSGFGTQNIVHEAEITSACEAAK